MQAVKVFNNNAVSVVMPDGREAILVGNGLGFGRRPGDVIDKSRVSKVYYVQNELQTKFLKGAVIGIADDLLDRLDELYGIVGQRAVRRTCIW